MNAFVVSGNPFRMELAQVVVAARCSCIVAITRAPRWPLLNLSNYKIRGTRAPLWTDRCLLTCTIEGFRGLLHGALRGPGSPHPGLFLTYGIQGPRRPWLE
jgi:hypothetical protein